MNGTTVQELEQKYRALFENAPEAVMIYDAGSGQMVDFNQKTIQLFKYSSVELLTKSPADLSPPFVHGEPSKVLSQKYIQEALNGGNPVFDWVHLDGNGREIPCEVRLVRFPPYDRQLVRGSVIDKTKERSMKTVLKQSRERYRSVIEASMDAFFLLEAVQNAHSDIIDFRIVEVNENAVFQMAVPHQKLVGHLLTEIFPFPCIGTLINQYKTVIETGESLSREYKIPDGHSGTGWYHQQVVRVGEGLAIMNRNITKRKKNEDALQEREERLKLALKTTGLGYFDWFVKEGKLVWDDQMYALHGLSKKSKKDPNEHFFQSLHPEDKERVISNFDRLMGAGSEATSFEDEYRILKNGDIRYMVTLGLIMRNDAGEVIRIIGTSRDITDTRARECELRTTQKKLEGAQRVLENTLGQLQLAVKTAKLGIWRFDMESGNLNWNDQLLEIYGITREAFNGDADAWRNLVHPDDIVEADERFDNITKGKFVYDVPFRIVRPDGEIRYISASGGPVFNEAGEIVELTGINIDVTHIKINEEALLLNEERLKLAFSATKLGYFDWYPLTGNAIWDDRMYQLFGMPKTSKEDKQEYFVKILHPEDRDRVAGNYAQVLNPQCQEIYFEDEYRIIKNGEVLHIVGYGYVLRNDRGEVQRMIGTVQDITERREAENALIESEDRFSKTFHKNPNMMMLVDFETMTILDVNEAYCNKMGYVKEEVVNIPGKVGHAISNIEMKHAAEKILKAKDKIADFEIKFVNKKGKEITSLLFAEPIDFQNRRVHVINMIDISDRKRAEQKLQESEERFSKAFNENITPMMIADIGTGERLDMNKSYVELFETTEEQLRRDNIYQKNLWVDPNEQQKIMERIRKDKFVDYYPAEVYTGSGQIKNMLLNVVMLDIGKGELALASFIDITDRKKAERALQESEERFRTIFNQQFQFMVILSLEGRILEVNDLLVKASGYPKDQIAGNFFWDAPAWKNLPEWQAIIKKQVFTPVLSGKPILTEDLFETATGEHRYILGAYSTIQDTDQQNLYILVQGTDITERKLAVHDLKSTQNELRELNDRFQISTQAAQVGIWDWNPITDTLIWDDIMLNLYGITRDEFTETSEFWRSKLHPEDVTTSKQELILALKGEKDFNTEFKIIWPDQSIHFIKAMATVQRDKDGKAIRMLGTNWDITKEKEAERQKIRARQLELKNKELEQFAYVASHDLQEPLRTVMGFVGLLKKHSKDKMDERAEEYLQYISQASHRMSKLIKALLDYSRIGLNKTTMLLDCNDLVQEILADLSIYIKETETTFEIGQLPEILGYETEFRILLQNLISNAMKFRKKDQNPLIRISAQETTEGWEFCIADNGIGIDPKYWERIFVIFQRLHLRNEYEGTGIGLAHCQKIVDLHGGKIWVKSIPGEGSRFYFTITS